MPLTASSAWKSALSRSPSTLCLGVRIHRLDGWIGGYTTLPQDITLSDSVLPQDGPMPPGNNTLIYTSGAGLSPTTLSTKSSLSPDTINLELLLDLPDGPVRSGITPLSVEQGRFRDAHVLLFTLDYFNLGLGPFEIRRCFIGGSDINASTVQFEVESWSVRSRVQVGAVTTSTCRCRRVGDAQCQADMTLNTSDTNFPRRVVNATVTGVTDERRFTVSAVSGYPANHFRYGRVLFLTGANAGLAGTTQQDSSGFISLREPLLVNLSVGDKVTLEAGCDRTITTCKAKFNNVIHFRGEPRAPTLDQTVSKG
jgi:uncharacterized phage protein (TIGR02218 family)